MPPHRNPRPQQDTTRINDRIQASHLRVIDADGKQLGVIALNEALALADQAELDLVEIAPDADPPVCRILDYSKFKYEKSRKEKEQRKQQLTQRRLQEVKEVRLHVKTGEHDFQTKVRAAHGFISKGHHAKVGIRFKGREITHPQLARTMLERFAAELADIARVEQAPTMSGREMSMMLAPHK